MLISILAGAATFGFLGSLHCTFMCGPLAVAGCGAGSGLRRSAVALYFGGRLASYVFAGAAFGALGAHVGCLVHLEKMQQCLLVAVATLAFVKGVKLSLGAVGAPSLMKIGRPSLTRRVARSVASLIPRRALSLGLATGVLPCGLLAGAWSLAAATGRPLHGALVMLVFWAATAPALASSLLANHLARGARSVFSARAQGLLWCALGLWIIARSLLLHGVHQHGGH
jgi:sulfite exporter TauE/SafE